MAALLIDKGANPNLGDTAGMAALYAAVDMAHQAPMINRPLAKPSGKLRAMDVIARLLDHRADPNQPLKTPLLMRQHEFGDAPLGEGATPLMRAAKAADAALLRLMLDKGADPNRADEERHHRADGHRRAARAAPPGRAADHRGARRCCSSAAPTSTRQRQRRHRAAPVRRPGDDW